MRTSHLLFSIVILGQLTACAHQQRYSSSEPEYPGAYRTQYPAQYPAQQPNSYQNQPQYPNQYQNAYPAQNSGQYQNMSTESAQIIGLRDVSPAGQHNQSGAGAVVGAVLGGVIGHQFGKGSGRDLATVGGAIAGGVVGNEMERSSAPQNRTEMSLRLNNGEVRTILIDNAGQYRIGDRIRVGVQNGQLVIIQ